jgi:hypothetical protein
VQLLRDTGAVRFATSERVVLGENDVERDISVRATHTIVAQFSAASGRLRFLSPQQRAFALIAVRSEFRTK